MVAPIHSNISALAAFSKKMQVSANNVANVYSDDFKKSRAVITEGQNNHVDVNIEKIETPGPLVEDPMSETGELKELSNTDLAEEFMTQIVTKHGYEANAKTIQVYDEMVGNIIDMME